MVDDHNGGMSMRRSRYLLVKEKDGKIFSERTYFSISLFHNIEKFSQPIYCRRLLIPFNTVLETFYPRTKLSKHEIKYRKYVNFRKYICVT